MPRARPRLRASVPHAVRMRRLAPLALAALTACAVAHGAGAAEGSSLRGLRAPGFIDFAPADVSRFDIPAWRSAAESDAFGRPQPSLLYGYRERLPGDVSRSESARLSYSYSDTLTGIVEAGPALLSPYASAYALSSQLVRTFDSGLGVGLGLRQKQTGTQVFAVALQQEWGPFRGAYTLYSGRAEAEPSPSHRLALNFDYGNRSSIGLAYTTGRDLRSGMLPYTPGADSRDWTLTGFHWLAPQWALTYDVVNSDQAAYRRQGLRFGIRHTF
jgi:hypothetical protein